MPLSEVFFSQVRALEDRGLRPWFGPPAREHSTWPVACRIRADGAERVLAYGVGENSAEAMAQATGRLPG